METVEKIFHKKATRVTIREPEKEEKHSFLKRENSKTQNKHLLQPSRKKKTCCDLKCCCVSIFLAILATFGLSIGGYYLIRSKLTGSAIEENSIMWKAIFENSVIDRRLKFHSEAETINGEYQMVSYDKDYKVLLEAIGIPRLLRPLILESSQYITMTVEEDIWTKHYKDDLEEHTVQFMLEEEYEEDLGIIWDFAILLTTCTKMSLLTLNCTSVEIFKNWDFYTLYQFYPGLGFVMVLCFPEENLSAEIYYQLVTNNDAQKNKKQESPDFYDDDPMFDEEFEIWVQSFNSSNFFPYDNNHD